MTEVTLQGRPGAATRRIRVLVWVLVVAVLTAVLGVVVGMNAPNDQPLHPNNPGDEGLQALHRVLGNEGIDIEVVTSLPALSSARIDQHTTVAVVGTAQLNQAAGDSVVEVASGADQILVILSPSSTDRADGVAAIAGRPVSLAPSVPGPRPRAPECADPRWRDGDVLTDLGPGIQIDLGDGDGDGDDQDDSSDSSDSSDSACFPPSPGYNLGGASTWHQVHLAADDDERPAVVLFAGAAALTNSAILQEANAAAGLRLLGANDRVVWYIPSPADGLAEGTGGMADVLPRGFLQAAVVLGLAVLALMFWRGRRMGRLVTEPLPAVIRSTETTRARAGLYRKAGARSRALAALQQAARARLAIRLGLSSHAVPAQIVHAVATRTGREPHQVTRILTDTDVQDDAQLVRLARDLRTLEEGITLR